QHERADSRDRAAYAWARGDGVEPCPPILRRAAEVQAEPETGARLQRGAEPPAGQRPQPALARRTARLHEHEGSGDAAGEMNGMGFIVSYTGSWLASHPSSKKRLMDGAHSFGSIKQKALDGWGTQFWVDQAKSA